jgi:hypothetical protein
MGKQSQIFADDTINKAIDGVGQHIVYKKIDGFIVPHITEQGLA